MPRDLAHYAGAVQLQAVPSVRLGGTVGAPYDEAGEVDVERGLRVRLSSYGRLSDSEAGPCAPPMAPPRSGVYSIVRFDV